MSDYHASFEPNELDSTVTALGNIWKQAFSQLRNPDATDENIESLSIASTELLRQVLRLSREKTTSVISREQLRHLNTEDKYDDRVIETQAMFKELHGIVVEGFAHVDQLIKPVLEQLTATTEDHEARIVVLETRVRELEQKA